jgi:hypothetical protein
MSAVCHAATLTAAGIPQVMSIPTSPSQPQTIVGGLTYSAGSVSMRDELLLQTAPTNTGAKIYVGWRSNAAGCHFG